MDFIKGEYSFCQQNGVADNTDIDIVNGYCIRKGVGSYKFIQKKQYGFDVIEQYSDLYYVFPKAIMIVFYKNKEWYKYILKDEKYILSSISKYIILNKELLLSYSKNAFSLNTYSKNTTEIVLENTLGTGDDFIISTKKDKIIIVGNKFANRKTMYNFNTKEYENYVNKGTNKIETKTLIVYYDNISGADIYDKKGQILYRIHKYYILLKYLIAYKEDNRYIVLDIKNNKQLFTGSIFYESRKEKYCIDKNKDEIFVVDYERKSIDIFNYKTYKKEQKTLKKFNFKLYGE